VCTVSAEPDETQPGVGLLNHHDAEAREVVELLQALVSGGSPPSLESLEAVTAPGTLITPQVIEGIQARPAAEQALFIGKLAGQVALERTVEVALLARRMLLTGMRDPHVSATPAPRQLQPFLAELEREIENLPPLRDPGAEGAELSHRRSAPSGRGIEASRFPRSRARPGSEAPR
jgi:hypothetical protein